jgi:hypothetical protein
MLALIWAGIELLRDFRCVDDRRRPFVDVDAFVGAPGPMLAGTLLSGCGCFALIVALEEDVEDSRTDGKALPEAFFVLVLAALIICLGRSGLFEEYFWSCAEVIMNPLECDEAELGVGAWLYGDSVCLDEGVAEWERPGTGGVKSRMEYAWWVSSDGRIPVPAGAADLRYESLYSFFPVGGNEMPNTASSYASS